MFTSMQNKHWSGASLTKSGRHMKNLILALSLVVASCAGPRGTVDVSADTAFSRTAYAVAERCPQEDLDVITFVEFLNAATGDISVQIVGPLYDPVEELHDLEILTGNYEALDQEIYIGDTQALRALLIARGYKAGE